jgi:hypothetical protein
MLAAGDVATAAAWNVITNDVIDHETRILDAPILVYSNTITASTFAVDNVFTSTYANYTIHLSVFGSAATAGYMRMRVGGVNSSSGYYMSGVLISYAAATVTGVNDTNAAQWSSRFLHSDTGTATRSTCTMSIFGPQIVCNTAVHGNFTDPRTNGSSGPFSGWHNSNASYDGFEIFPATGTLTGSIRVYGLPNS